MQISHELEGIGRFGPQNCTTRGHLSRLNI